MYSIIVYIPEDHCENVKTAMFAAGAGKIGNYAACSWQVSGTGQFMPLEKSQPFLGEQGKVELVSEVRVEMVCEKQYLRQAIHALRQSHPYETPAFHVIECLDEAFLTR